MDERVIIVESADRGIRLDVFLADELGVTRSSVAAKIRGGSVTVGGAAVKSGYPVKSGDCIRVALTEEPSDIVPENIPLDILYEDGSIAVVNKPQGMTVHPGGGVHTGTLANALMYRFESLSSAGGAVRPGIVHRLDKDTSGVLVVAKNDRAHLELSRQFANREPVKLYRAMLEGNLKADSGEVKTLIGRDPKNRKLMCVTLRDGREAVTRYRVPERFKENCCAAFEILTGRTHQIRVHCKYLSHPVVGDAQYGYKKQRFRLNGQLLHAESLTIRHPETGESMTFTAPLPEYFEKVLEVLRNEKRITKNE